MKALTSLRSTFQLFNAATDGGRVPTEIGRCLELVQTCHKDLQHLIDLRNKHLSFLEKTPHHVLTRINSVIEAADKGLAEARRIVEKCRPAAHRNNKTPLHSKIEWVLSSSSDFKAQEPIISRHHAAVLAELTYVRQITMWTLLDNGGSVIGHQSHGSLFGDSSSDRKSISYSPPALLLHSRTDSNIALPSMIHEYSDLPEAVFPNALPEPVSSPETVSHSLRPMSSTWTVSQNESTDSRARTLSTNDTRGLSLLFNG